MKLKTIDILIPAYIPEEKYKHLLQRAITSLEKQTYKNFGVICVLNGCYCDYQKIIEFIKTDLDIVYLKQDGKTSGAIARNFAISKSNAGLIAQIDVDDQYHPKKIERQIKYFLNNPDIDFVGTLAWEFHSKEKIIPSCFKEGQYEHHKDIVKRLSKENVMCHGSVMFKRDSFNKINGYNEIRKPDTFWPEYRAFMNEDWDLWIRAVWAGCKFYNIPERLYYWSAGTSVER